MEATPPLPPFFFFFFFLPPDLDFKCPVQPVNYRKRAKSEGQICKMSLSLATHSGLILRFARLVQSSLQAILSRPCTPFSVITLFYPFMCMVARRYLSFL